MSENNSHQVTDFHGRSLPEPARLVGYAALIERYHLEIPLPPRFAAVAIRHHPTSTEAWQLFTPRHAPDDTLSGHLEFAIKWEGVDLSVLAALFKVVPDEEIAAAVRSKPTGAYARRLWYLHEWLTGRQLDINDPGKVRAVPIVDSTKQFAVTGGTLSSRHKVIDNLPGTRAFCPMVRRNETLGRYAAKGLDKVARNVVGRIHRDVMARAAAFLLLSDSKSSFWIEGERPSPKRALRWGQIIGEAGSRKLSIAELERLQRIVIGDARFVRLGLRTEGGFVGTHDRTNNEPIPDHISARSDDLKSLVEGVIAYVARAVDGAVDSVVVAAAAAFGFVYIHPFSDGNGRLHRWLIHHALAAAGFNPPGVILAVSAAMLRNIDGYREVLESYSRPLLECIDWRVTADGNVEVLNQTSDYYRYFDATAHAEFLYRCVEQTIERDLPEEISYLQAYDRFAHGIQEIADMPADKIELLHGFLRQENGRLSKRARDKEFAALTDREAEQIEKLYRASLERKGETAEA
jgi:Fic family protein